MPVDVSAGRILLLLIVVAVTAWLVRSSPLLRPASPEPGSASPIQKARTAAAASSARASQTDAAAQAADSPSAGGSVTENMTPEQVRSILGAPDSVDSETTESGVAREKWNYRRAGKTVVFENGIAVRIE
jgi:hypothetical protein